MKTYHLCEWCGNLYEDKKETEECEINDQSVPPKYKRGEVVYFRSLMGMEKCKILSIKRKLYELNFSAWVQPHFSENSGLPMLVKLINYPVPEKKIKNGKRTRRLKQMDIHFAYAVDFLNEDLRPCDKIRLVESSDLTKTFPKIRS